VGMEGSVFPSAHGHADVPGRRHMTILAHLALPGVRRQIFSDTWTIPSPEPSLR
jgi:hypothetical protein